MSRAPVGARVGAILKADNTEVHLLGFGIYDGEHEPPFGPMGAPKAEYDAWLEEAKAAGHVAQDYAWKNPRITLDDGRVVWGCQCWWGPEEAIRKHIEGLRVIRASV